MRRMNRGISVAPRMVFFTLVAVLLSVKANAEVIKFQLENGLRVVIINANTSRVAVVARVGAGFSDEIQNVDPALDESGVSHELEHSLFRGTQNHPSKELFIGAVRAAGAEYNASTDFVKTNYFMVAPSEKFEDIVSLHSDMLSVPLLASANFASEAKPVSEEIMRNYTNPYFKLYEYSIMLHSNNERLQVPMASSAERTLGHSPEVIRGFFKRYYSAKNMTLAIVGDVGDIEKAKKLVEEKYGRIASFDVAKQSEAETMEIGGANTNILYKVKTPSENTKMLSLAFTLPYNPILEPTANLLASYLGRVGINSPLHKLYERNLVKSVHSSTDVYKDKMVFRVFFDLTQSGEMMVQSVVDHVSKVMGSLAKNGMSENDYTEIRLASARAAGGGAGLLGTAEEITNEVAAKGFNSDQINAMIETLVSPEQVKKVAAKLTPEAMELTLLTSNVSNPTQKLYGLDVEEKNISSWKEQWKRSFGAGNLELPQVESPFIRSMSSRQITLPGVNVTVVPEGHYTQALLKIQVPQIQSSLMAQVALVALQEDPESVLLSQQMRDAGVYIRPKFDSQENALYLEIIGEPNEVSLAQNLFFRKFKNFSLSEESLARAKTKYIQHLKSLPASEVAGMAINNVFNGYQGAVGGKTFFNFDAYVTGLVEKTRNLKLAEVQGVWTQLKTSEHVSGVLQGDWNQSMIYDLLAKVTPTVPVAPRESTHTAEMPRNIGTKLIVQPGIFERQGVARLIPLPIEKYSKPYWVFKIFAKILDERLDQIVRTERGLVYAVSAGFAAIPEGGSALYMAADSSHSAAKLAMSYTATLEQILSAGIDDEEFQWAYNSTVEEITEHLTDIDGVFARRYGGMNAKTILEAVEKLDKEKFLEVVRHYLPSLESAQIDSRTHVDSAVVGRNDASCSSLLKR